MDKRRRLNLSLSMASPLQREAWAILSAIPAGQRTDAVCHAVCRAHEESTMLDALRAVLREELGGARFTTEKSMRTQEAGDVGDDVLGFLLALQDDGGDEKTDPLLQSTALYELLAEKDPELASMLTAYKELTKKEDMNHV